MAMDCNEHRLAEKAKEKAESISSSFLTGRFEMDSWYACLNNHTDIHLWMTVIKKLLCKLTSVLHYVVPSYNTSLLVFQYPLFVMYYDNYLDVLQAAGLSHRGQPPSAITYSTGGGREAMGTSVRHIMDGSGLLSLGSAASPLLEQAVTFESG